MKPVSYTQDGLTIEAFSGAMSKYGFSVLEGGDVKFMSNNYLGGNYGVYDTGARKGTVWTEATWVRALKKNFRELVDSACPGLLEPEDAGTEGEDS